MYIGLRTLAPGRLTSNMENIVLSQQRARDCDVTGLVIVKKIQERPALSGGNAAVINQGQPMGN